MKKTLALFFILAFCFAGMTALAETVTLAFGYELELPEGVEITEEHWTPGDELVYHLRGTYKSSGEQPVEEQFILKLFSIQIPPEKMIERIDSEELYVFNRTGISFEDFGTTYFAVSDLAVMGTYEVNSEFQMIAREFAEAGVFEPEKEAARGSQDGASEGLTATVATKSSPLGMRETPGGDGAVILEIPKGKTVTVLEPGEWPLVEYNGQRGYVNGKYLEMNP